MKFLWSRAVTAAAVVAFATSTAAVYASTPTPPGTPSRPNTPRATALDTQVKLSWLAPTARIPPIEHYTITQSPGGKTYTTPDTAFTVVDLVNGTKYTFTITATNIAAQTGPPSTPIAATPRAVPPGRPTNLGATQTAPGQIRIDWTPPTTNGSMPDGSNAQITRYNITVNPGGIRAVVPATTLTYTASGLSDNVTYTFQVSATNTRPLTGAAATVYAPLPTGANIGLQPTAGGANTSITVTGSLFLKNESITLYWDVTSHVAASVVTDDTGAFTQVVKPFAGDKPKVHRLCASVQPHPCASFSLQGPPTPTPGVTPSPAETPTPTPAETPQASGARPGGGGISGLDIITRPPFVFLPILGVLGILGVLAYWWLSRRRQVPPSSAATIVHRATRPDYTAPFPTAGTMPAAPQPPGPPSAWDAPLQSAPPAQPYAPPAVQPPPAPFVPTPYVPPPVPPQAPPPPPTPPASPPRAAEWPAPQNPPAAPDEPPDLPQPSD